MVDSVLLSYFLCYGVELQFIFPCLLHVLFFSCFFNALFVTSCVLVLNL